MAAIVFSKDDTAAYLAAIIRSFEEQHSSYLGRTALQKLAYFSKVLGVPIPCRFNIYTYGPYSDHIAFTADSLVADDIIADRSTAEAHYSNYKLGAQGGRYLNSVDAKIRSYMPTIDTVVRAFGGFDPAELELIATLHFIAQRQRIIGRHGPMRKRVVEEFLKAKKDKFDAEEINAWYDALERAKLI